MDQIKGNAADYIAKACPKAAGKKIGNGAKYFLAICYIMKGNYEKAEKVAELLNEKEYLAAWQYIENNPLQPDTATDQPDFSNFT